MGENEEVCELQVFEYLGNQFKIRKPHDERQTENKLIYSGLCRDIITLRLLEASSIMGPSVAPLRLAACHRTVLAAPLQ